MPIIIVTNRVQNKTLYLKIPSVLVKKLFEHLNSF